MIEFWHGITVLLLRGPGRVWLILLERLELLQDRLLLCPEMLEHNVAEIRRGVEDLMANCPVEGVEPDTPVVMLRRRLGVGALLSARLVVVGLLHEDKPLDGDEDLKDCGFLRDPRRPVPGAEEGQADITILIQVGVELVRSPSDGQVLDTWRSVWIVRREEDVKLEAAVGVRGVLWSCYHCLDQLGPALVHPHKDRGGGGDWQA
mmetsp:Transcript_28983/g.93368  ORF Transcript_28983/g.93368 Transcript_28983/m.93368 type:complete len:205 (+) Transcript_28983:210-824(+)